MLSTRGQCHLNKKNVAEALLFEGKALLLWSLAMERGIGALNDARVKAQTAWRQHRSRFAQIRHQALLQSGNLLPAHHTNLTPTRASSHTPIRTAPPIHVPLP